MYTDFDWIKFLLENNVRYYPAHTCACGCNGLIRVKKYHICNGIPKYVHGHANKDKDRIWDESRKSTYRLNFRGNQKCTLCKSIYNLEVHHIDHDRENSERNNLIILCRTCHRFWHRKRVYN